MVDTFTRESMNTVTPVDTKTQAATEDSSALEVEVGDANVVDTSVDATTTAADEAAAAEALAASDATDEQVDQEAAKPKGNGARERIEGLVDENKSLRDFADFWQKKAMEGLKAPATTEATPAATTTTAVVEEAPTLEGCDFDTAKWTKAFAAFTQKQVRAELQSQKTVDQQAQSAAEVRSTYEAKCVAFEAAHPDFKILISNPNLPHLDRGAAELIVKSEQAAEITYHLAKHPDKAVRIARQTPAQQAAAIGRLEVELKPVTKTVQKIVTKKITTAPNPPTPVKSGGSSGTSQEELMAGPMDAWVAHERAAKKAERDARRKLAMR